VLQFTFYDFIRINEIGREKRERVDDIGRRWRLVVTRFSKIKGSERDEEMVVKFFV
jgi:hypothetical protein